MTHDRTAKIFAIFINAVGFDLLEVDFETRKKLYRDGKTGKTITESEIKKSPGFAAFIEGIEGRKFPPIMYKRVFIPLNPKRPFATESLAVSDHRILSSYLAGYQLGTGYQSLLTDHLTDHLSPDIA